VIPRTIVAVVLTLATLAGSAAAQGVGDKRRIVGILDVRVDGVPKEIARQFQVDLEKQLDSKAYWLAPQQRMRELMSNSTKWTEGCFVGPCLAEVRTQTGADVVLLASISGSGTSFGYVVTLMRTDTGRFVAQETSRCEVCTVNEALTSATLAALKLLTSVPSTLADEEVAAGAEVVRLRQGLVAEHDKTKRRHRIVGIALTLTGIAIAGAGMTAYFVKDRADGGLGAAGVGLGVAGAGVVTLTF